MREKRTVIARDDSPEAICHYLVDCFASFHYARNDNECETSLQWRLAEEIHKMREIALSVN